MDKHYDFKTKETEIYEMWENLNLFTPEGVDKFKGKSDKQKNSYTVLMPPPNANASLHAGHATYAIQDLMVRFKRMQGFDTLYLPGTDHAGFETQVVYERHLKKEGKSRFDFDRQTLYKKILEFVMENSEVAISQMKKLGLSADWDRNTFMLDDKVIKTVHETFIKMHEDGYIYRSGYMVNYSTFHGTTFSDLETEYKDSVSPLYYVKYKIKDSDKYISVATVRPETIYADVAISVNPDDKRFKELIGLVAINPLNGRELPIISDSYVDIEFGTGALKITPGHDFNDYEIGKKHNLEILTCINLDGKMNKLALDVEGMFPKPARKKVGEILLEKGALEKIDETYENRVLVDYKDQMPIEPMVLPNWFIKMKGKESLIDPVIKAVKNDDVRFNKDMWKKEILRWLKDIRDWPISRQTVFGIRIPVWYEINKNIDLRATCLINGNIVNGLVSELLEKYSIKEIKDGLQRTFATSDSTYIVSVDDPGDGYLPETDTFDTWFSSGQWPLTTTGYPDGEDYKNYYPTDFLDSMWDIIFFWIARMIMFSLYLTKEEEGGPKVPFKNVYFHGAITDKHGTKMSKSKGNVINPLDYIEKYGADALRMGIIVGGNTASKTSPLDEDKVRGYRNFANKIWNVGRFILSKKDEYKKDSKGKDDFKFVKDMDGLQDEDKKVLLELDNLVKTVTSDFDSYWFKKAGEDIYQFMWETLANDYLEAIKGRNDKESLIVLQYVFETTIKLLHPLMPFVTEAVWHELGNDKPIIVSDWPKLA